MLVLHCLVVDGLNHGRPQEVQRRRVGGPEHLQGGVAPVEDITVVVQHRV